MADDAPVAETPSAESQTCILIVDDHEDNIMVLKVRLESWGYQTASTYVMASMPLYADAV